MSIQTWFERAEIEIQEEHESGNISDKEYRQAMRDLQQEYDDYAREDAEALYNSYY